MILIPLKRQKIPLLKPYVASLWVSRVTHGRLTWDRPQS
jgi:hypothetical protein